MDPLPSCLCSSYFVNCLIFYDQNKLRCTLPVQCVQLSLQSTHQGTTPSQPCHRLFCFVYRGESPGCRLFRTGIMFEWLRNLLPYHSQGIITERCSRNILRVVTARVFYVLMGSLTSPLFLIIQWRRQLHITWSATHDVVISGEVLTSCWDRTGDP